MREVSVSVAVVAVGATNAYQCATSLTYCGVAYILEKDCGDTENWRHVHKITVVEA